MSGSTVLLGWSHGSWNLAIVSPVAADRLLVYLADFWAAAQSARYLVLVAKVPCFICSISGCIMLQQKKTAIKQDRAAVFQLIYERQHSPLAAASWVEDLRA
jgi:hypothetical protein